jgi:hypothetical protein
MDVEAFKQYMRGTAAGRASSKMAQEKNPGAGSIEVPILPDIDPFYIKIFNIRVLPVDEKTGLRIGSIVYHGLHGEHEIPSAEPGLKAVPDETKPRGTYKMVPCAKIESYSRPYFVPSLQTYTHFNPMTGVTEVLPKDVIQGEDVAESIVNAPGIDTDLREWGVIVTKNDVPSKEEMDIAVGKLKAKYQRLFNEGESLAAQGKIKNITNTQREAAAWLGKPVSWNQVVEMYETCEGCGNPVKAEVVVHSCGWVRNWQKAVENGMRKIKDVPESKRWWSGEPAVK